MDHIVPSCASHAKHGLQLVKVLRFKDTDVTFKAVWGTLTTFCTYSYVSRVLDTNYAAAVLAILLLIATFVIACLVMQNFGRGLKTQSK